MQINDDMFVDLPPNTRTEREKDVFFVFMKEKGTSEFRPSSIAFSFLANAVTARNNAQATHPEDEFEVRLVKTVVETTVFMSTFVG